MERMIGDSKKQLILNNAQMQQAIQAVDSATQSNQPQQQQVYYSESQKSKNLVSQKQKVAGSSQVVGASSGSATGPVKQKIFRRDLNLIPPSAAIVQQLDYTRGPQVAMTAKNSAKPTNSLVQTTSNRHGTTNNEQNGHNLMRQQQQHNVVRGGGVPQQQSHTQGISVMAVQNNLVNENELVTNIAIPSHLTLNNATQNNPNVTQKCSQAASSNKVRWSGDTKTPQNVTTSTSTKHAFERDSKSGSNIQHALKMSQAAVRQSSRQTKGSSKEPGAHFSKAAIKMSLNQVIPVNAASVAMQPISTKSNKSHKSTKARFAVEANSLRRQNFTCTMGATGTGPHSSGGVGNNSHNHANATNNMRQSKKSPTRGESAGAATTNVNGSHLHQKSELQKQLEMVQKLVNKRDNGGGVSGSLNNAGGTQAPNTNNIVGSKTNNESQIQYANQNIQIARQKRDRSQKNAAKNSSASQQQVPSYSTHQQKHARGSISQSNADSSRMQAQKITFTGVRKGRTGVSKEVYERSTALQGNENQALGNKLNRIREEKSGESNRGKIQHLFCGSNEKVVPPLSVISPATTKNRENSKETRKRLMLNSVQPNKSHLNSTAVTPKYFKFKQGTNTEVQKLEKHALKTKTSKNAGQPALGKNKALRISSQAGVRGEIVVEDARMFSLGSHEEPSGPTSGCLASTKHQQTTKRVRDIQSGSKSKSTSGYHSSQVNSNLHNQQNQAVKRSKNGGAVSSSINANSRGVVAVSNGPQMRLTEFSDVKKSSTTAVKKIASSTTAHNGRGSGVHQHNHPRQPRKQMDESAAVQSNNSVLSGSGELKKRFKRVEMGGVKGGACQRENRNQNNTASISSNGKQQNKSFQFGHQTALMSCSSGNDSQSAAITHQQQAAVTVVAPRHRSSSGAMKKVQHGAKTTATNSEQQVQQIRLQAIKNFNPVVLNQPGTSTSANNINHALDETGYLQGTTSQSTTAKMTTGAQTTSNHLQKSKKFTFTINRQDEMSGGKVNQIRLSKHSNLLQNQAKRVGDTHSSANVAQSQNVRSLKTVHSLNRNATNEAQATSKGRKKNTSAKKGTKQEQQAAACGSHVYSLRQSFQDERGVMPTNYQEDCEEKDARSSFERVQFKQTQRVGGDYSQGQKQLNLIQNQKSAPMTTTSAANSKLRSAFTQSGKQAGLATKKKTVHKNARKESADSSLNTSGIIGLTYQQQPHSKLIPNSQQTGMSQKNVLNAKPRKRTQNLSSDSGTNGQNNLDQSGQDSTIMRGSVTAESVTIANKINERKDSTYRRMEAELAQKNAEVAKLMAALQNKDQLVQVLTQKSDNLEQKVRLREQQKCETSQQMIKSTLQRLEGKLEIFTQISKKNQFGLGQITQNNNNASLVLNQSRQHAAMTPDDDENRSSQKSELRFERGSGIATPMTISRASKGEKVVEDDTLTQMDIYHCTNTSQKKKKSLANGDELTTHTSNLLGGVNNLSSAKKGRESATLQRRRDLEVKRASQVSVGVESLVTVCEYAGTQCNDTFLAGSALSKRKVSEYNQESAGSNLDRQVTIESKVELLSDKKPQRGLAIDFAAHVGQRGHNEIGGGDVIMFDQNEMDITSLEDIEISNVQDASLVMLEKDLGSNNVGTHNCQVSASASISQGIENNFFLSNRLQSNNFLMQPDQSPLSNNNNNVPEPIIELVEEAEDETARFMESTFKRQAKQARDKVTKIKLSELSRQVQETNLSDEQAKFDQIDNDFSGELQMQGNKFSKNVSRGNIKVSLGSKKDPHFVGASLEQDALKNTSKERNLSKSKKSGNNVNERRGDQKKLQVVTNIAKLQDSKPKMRLSLPVKQIVTTTNASTKKGSPNRKFFVQKSLERNGQMTMTNKLAKNSLPMSQVFANVNLKNVNNATSIGDDTRSQPSQVSINMGQTSFEKTQQTKQQSENLKIQSHQNPVVQLSNDSISPATRQNVQVQGQGKMLSQRLSTKNNAHSGAKIAEQLTLQQLQLIQKFKEMNKGKKDVNFVQNRQ